MPESMQCPICGRHFSPIRSQILSNGNPACPECVAKELAKKKPRTSNSIRFCCTPRMTRGAFLRLSTSPVLSPGLFEGL